MIIDCIGCLHGSLPDLEGGDLLILTGDYTASDKLEQWHKLFDWLDNQKYRKKVLIAGNHDNFAKNWAVAGESIDDAYEKIYPGEKRCFDYLCDSGMEFEGLKIWGSPWTASFIGINPKCTAFTIPVSPDMEDRLMDKWMLIPFDIDILITHTPPFATLDGIPMEDGSSFHVGSKSLYGWLKYVGRPRLHVFSHIHEAYGKQEHLAIHNGKMMMSVNCSIMDGRYRPVNKPVRISLDSYDLPSDG